jgi:hypothetical protein
MLAAACGGETVKTRCALLLVSLAWMLPSACSVELEHMAEPTAGDADAGAAAGADAQGHTAPTHFTEAANAAVAKALPLADPQDFEDAQRGLVASDPNLVVKDAAGGAIWDAGQYAFVTGDAPSSVNPSLWRQANGVCTVSSK